MVESWFKEIVSFNKIGYNIELLSIKIKKSIQMNNIKYDFIYPIPRGGLIVGVYLSHLLDIKLISEINNSILNNFKILVVDDIADTGKTLTEFESKADLATIYYKPRSIIKPTYYVEETVNWIVFPWEREDEIPNREL